MIGFAGSFYGYEGLDLLLEALADPRAAAAGTARAAGRRRTAGRGAARPGVADAGSASG